MTTIIDIYWQDFDKAMEAKDFPEALKIADQARTVSDIAARDMELKVAVITNPMPEDPEL